MDLTQLERIKTELKRRFYGGNKIERTFTRLTIDLEGQQKDLQDTLNSARETDKARG
jgi:hypothetical protein